MPDVQTRDERQKKTLVFYRPHKTLFLHYRACFNDKRETDDAVMVGDESNTEKAALSKLTHIKKKVSEKVAYVLLMDTVDDGAPLPR